MTGAGDLALDADGGDDPVGARPPENIPDPVRPSPLAALRLLRDGALTVAPCPGCGSQLIAPMSNGVAAWMCFKCAPPSTDSKYIKADPPPIYDDIFEEGVKALDADGGDEQALNDRHPCSLCGFGSWEEVLGALGQSPSGSPTLRDHDRFCVQELFVERDQLKKRLDDLVVVVHKLTIERAQLKRRHNNSSSVVQALISERNQLRLEFKAYRAGAELIAAETDKSTVEFVQIVTRLGAELAQLPEISQARDALAAERDQLRLELKAYQTVAELTAAETKSTEQLVQITNQCGVDLAATLTDLAAVVAIVRRTGGHLSPADQHALGAAKARLVAAGRSFA